LNGGKGKYREQDLKLLQRDAPLTADSKRDWRGKKVKFLVGRKPQEISRNTKGLVNMEESAATNQYPNKIRKAKMREFLQAATNPTTIRGGNSTEQEKLEQEECDSGILPLMKKGDERVNKYEGPEEKGAGGQGGRVRGSPSKNTV